jgi:hypothetical protein
LNFLGGLSDVLFRSVFAREHINSVMLFYCVLSFCFVDRKFVCRFVCHVNDFTEYYY